ncbi:Solute carrier family 2, facilitated glucose transporter member 1 [Aphelenchoides fujianensis]|nr:Solute carrier family 2, facilitated glucose transporter member 1 [Aphelenchoides fujianensis]
MLSRWESVRLCGICLMISLICNFPAGVMNAAVNTAVHEFRRFLRTSFGARGISLEDDQRETWARSGVLNAWFVAQTVGSFLSPPLAEKYGRKGAFAISIAAMAAGAFSQFLAAVLSSPELFVFGRCLAAFFSPLADLCMITYFQECTPMHLRGSLSSLGGVGYAAMSSLGMLLGTTGVLGHSFTLLFAVQWPPVVLSLVFIFFLPETPNGDREAALRSLTFFQGRQPEHKQQVEEFLHEMEDKDEESGSSPVTIKELFTTPALRLSMLLALSVFVLDLPYYPLLQSSTFIFETIGIERAVAELTSTFIFVCYTAGSIVSYFLLDRYPRRRLLLTASAITGSCLFAFVVFAESSPWFPPLRYASSVVGPMSWFIGSELVTQRYRGLCFGVIFGVFNVLITATNGAALLAFEKFGVLSFIPLFIVPYAVVWEFLRRFLPETRGRAPVEVAAVIRRMCDEKTSMKAAEENERAFRAREARV